MDIGVTPNKYHNNYSYNSQKNSISKYILISILIIFLCVLFYLIFNFIFKHKDLISKNIYIENIDMSGKTQDEAKELLKSNFDYLNKDKAHFKIANTEFTLEAKELDYILEIDKSVESAFRLSIDNNFKAFDEKKNIPLDIKYDKSKMNMYITEILKLIPKSVDEKDLIKIENNNLIIYKGDDPVKITEDELKNIILKKFKSSNFKQIEEIPLTSSKKDIINFDEIYKKIEKAPKDAYINEKGQIIPEQNGIKLKYSKKEAENIFYSSDEKCIIPIEIIYPKIKVSDLKSVSYDDLLSEVSLKMPTNPIIKGEILSKLQNFNQLVIKNNHTFSYNKIQIGPKTDADIFIASGIYKLSMLLNLDIQEINKNNSLPEYIVDGLDAFVNNDKNLSFRNNLQNPIILKTSNSNDIITFRFYGKKVGLNTNIKLKSKIINIEPFKKEEIKNFNYDIGYEKIKQKGIDGQTIEVYKEVIINNKSNGVYKIGTYKYNPVNEIKEIGNKPSSSR